MANPTEPTSPTFLLTFAQDFPEHTKLASIGYKARPVAEFLAWMVTTPGGYCLARTVYRGSSQQIDHLLPVVYPETVIAAYIGADIEALRAERARMCGQQGRESGGA